MMKVKLPLGFGESNGPWDKMISVDQENAALRAENAALRAERDRAQKECEQITKRFTPRCLRYAPKDRLIIGVGRPPFEETTFFYDLIWAEHRKQFVTPFVEALNGATHFLDPRDLIGLPPQERQPRKRKPEEGKP